MDIVKILRSLKGKVLDASHFELLEHAYNIQEENIRQLKTNNEALKESNVLISEELSRLRSDRELLTGELSHVKALLPSEGYTLSEFAGHVLSIFERNDAIVMFESKLLEESQLTNIQTQSGITELQEYGLISYPLLKSEGMSYGLQPRGKERIARQQSAKKDVKNSP